MLIFYYQRKDILIYQLLSSVISMTNFFAGNSTQNMHEKERNVLLSQSQKLMRQNYKSPYRESQQQLSKQHVTSSNRFISGNDTMPPRAVPFRRSRNTSRERTEQLREQSDQYKHVRKVKETNVQSLMKLSSLEKKLSQQAGQKQKWRLLYLSQEQTINNMILQLTTEKQQKQKIKVQILKMKEDLLEKETKLAKNNQIIQNLNKNLKEHKINQKSLANLKNLQNQLDLIQQKNTKLTQQNIQLSKNNRKMKNQLKKKDSTSESDIQVNKKSQKMHSLQLQVYRLRGQLQKDRSQRQNILQKALRNLQNRLYEKQSQIKSMSIQLNFIDRKKYTSIDDIKTKKDQQIKDLKQKFLKVSRDLKQTKDKFQSNQKKKIPKSIRKVKSSKLLGTNSQSQEVTFELSSQH